MQTSKVAIITVSYFSSPLIEESIDVLLELGDVYVVDNSCDQIELERLNNLSATRSRLHVISANSNLGFGKGCALGVRVADSQSDGYEVIGMVNPDICIPDIRQAKESVLRFYRGESGYFQPTIHDSRGAASIQGMAYAEPVKLLLGYTLFKILFGVLKQSILFPSKSSQKVYVPSGACFFIRNNLLKQIGGFPEDMFLYFEEVVFAWRTKDLCAGGYIDCDFVVSHLVGSSTGLKGGRGNSKMLRFRLESFRAATDILLEGRAVSRLFTKLLIQMDHVARLLFLWWKK